MRKLVLALVLATTMVSCVSTQKGMQSSPVVSRNVELDPIKADINVAEKKVKGESKSAYFLFFQVKGDNKFAEGITYSTDASASMLQKINPLKVIQSGRLNKVRGASAYNALEGTDADFIVHPNYVTTVKNYLIYKEYKVEVTGYPAKYENFRTEKQDVYIIDGKEYKFTK